MAQSNVHCFSTNIMFNLFPKQESCTQQKALKPKSQELAKHQPSHLHSTFLLARSTLRRLGDDLVSLGQSPDHIWSSSSGPSSPTPRLLGTVDESHRPGWDPRGSSPARGCSGRSPPVPGRGLGRGGTGGVWASAGAGGGERKGRRAGPRKLSLGWRRVRASAREGREVASLRQGEAWSGEPEPGAEDPRGGADLPGAPSQGPCAEHEPAPRRSAAEGHGLRAALRRWAGPGSGRWGAGAPGPAGAGRGQQPALAGPGTEPWGAPGPRRSCCSCARPGCCGGASGCCCCSPWCLWGSGRSIWSWWRRRRSAATP